ncbi:hypothetical protein LC085_17200 [Bacillus tianshenii]|uniref:hypothetical protein n=1 Tax=Sutcliffiella tianshenii TaxID=1463404 RepID=UPI001CD30CAB|nr:hypothetical protein [Bacillus tianshenii]MCA1321646.1 hypothetical protein [Bacillus tianshenii]
MLVAVLSVLLSPAPAAMACDCDPPDSATEAMGVATAVFRGTVLKIHKNQTRSDGERYDEVLFSVSESWKGMEDSQAKIYTDSSSSCTFDFQEGNEYLLYPYSREGVMYIMDCGRSSDILLAEDDLEELGMGTAPTNIVDLEERQLGGLSVDTVLKWVVGIVFGVAVLVMFEVRRGKD